MGEPPRGNVEEGLAHGEEKGSLSAIGAILGSEGLEHMIPGGKFIGAVVGGGYHKVTNFLTQAAKLC